MDFGNYRYNYLLPVVKSFITEESKNQHRKTVQNLSYLQYQSYNIEEALDSNFKDYEDAVLYQSAVHTSLDAIITRNQKDFRESELPIYSPSEFLNALDILE